MFVLNIFKILPILEITADMYLSYFNSTQALKTHTLRYHISFHFISFLFVYLVPSLLARLGGIWFNFSFT